MLDFNAGACTFCEACAQACEESVFRDTDGLPWTLTAELGPSCLLRSGVSCRSCADVCGYGALLFDCRGGPVGAIAVDAAACTGCGACAVICPVNAITLKASARKDMPQ